MFNNDFFSEWLRSSSTEIMGRMKEGLPLRNEDMMILVLQGLSNHFDHLDKDLKNEMKSVRSDLHTEIQSVRTEIQYVRNDMDKRFDRLYGVLKWQGGIVVALFAGLYLKLFLG